MGIIATLLVIPLYIIRLIKEKGFSERFRQSFGVIPRTALEPVANQKCIWLHAASVGEIVAASPIVKEIRRQFPEKLILVSVITVNGYAMAKRIIPEADSIIYVLPDLPMQMHSIVAKIRPEIILLVETELWPGFLWVSKQFNVPVIMVNGRIGDKNVRCYKFLFFFFPHMLKTIVKFCMQSVIDAQYIIKLGANPRRVFVTGNTKFDQTYTNVSQTEKNEIVQQIKLEKRWPIIVAGSTHKGEEEIVFTAFKKILEHFESAALIVAPRAIQRANEVSLLAIQYNLSATLRTSLDSFGDENNIIILDTIGELGKIYSIGDVVYVGGSLVPRGGHNILEPAAHGKPIIVGPYMFNFKDTYALFSEHQACETVQDADELTDKLLVLLTDNKKRELMGERALAIINENCGATTNTVQHIKEILDTI
jgi:3-deoxy-D-manno-octulosonic-acid transferase